ncbi:carboxypeptidase-like regulatory domain-containing protein, partial [Flavobacteriales bacterium]|nr:carboxypeptidase-like regulatory domain-containing protein [Flavobacteriales bacterium]
MKFKILFIIILCLSFLDVSYASYIKGKVTDENGEALPFATVYIHNTTYGVTTNSIGNYFIELKPGNYSITYSFIGYQSIIHNVSLTKEPLTIDVILSAQTTQLVEFEVYSNTKNKAKEVMSNVRKN